MVYSKLKYLFLILITLSIFFSCGKTSNPEKDKEAVKFDALSFDEVLHKGLKVMDTTAFTISQENNLPIIVFDMNTPGNLEKVVKGENVGTRVY